MTVRLGISSLAAFRVTSPRPGEKP